MKKKHLAILLAAATLSLGAQATPFTINDDYWGANAHTYGDVIGAAGNFQIAGANLSLNGSVLTVDIFTNLAGKASQGLFGAYTHNGKGIGFGDLFLASSWKPHGTGPTYSADNATTGTDWTYGFAMNDHWSDTSGTGILYALNGTNLQDAILTDALMKGSVIYRNGQEVMINTTSPTVAATGTTGTWLVTPTSDTAMGQLSYTFDISNTSLWNPLPNGPMNIALHWAMACGNDTIEGQTVLFGPPPPNTSVPEPAALSLALLGLAGLGWRKRRAARG